MGISSDEDEGVNVDDHTFTAAYKRLPEQSATTVRFFYRESSEKYAVYGSKDSELVARLVYQNNSTIKAFGKGSNRLEYVNINRAKFETFVKDLLLVKQYRVEVYINKGSKLKYDWVLEYKGSPGNLTQFEDLLLSCNEVTVNNGVIGIKITSSPNKSKMVGLAHVNMNESELSLVEFIDNDSLCNLESVLVQLSPKEAVFGETSSHAADYAVLRKILYRNNVLINERKAIDFNEKDINQDLARLLKLKNGASQNVAALPEVDKIVACSALCGAIKYLDLLADEQYFNQFKIKEFDFGLYVKMDSAACRALHLDLNSREASLQKSSTLTSILDVCRTSQGHRLLAQYLKQPLVDLDKLEERLDITEMLVNDVVLRQSIHEEHLRRIPDCQVLARKLLKKRAELQDCHKGYLCILKLPKLIEDLRTNESSKKNVLNSYFIDPLQSICEELKKYQELVENTIDLDMAEKGDYVVRPDFDEVFQKLRAEMDEIENKLGDESYKAAKILQLEAQKTLKLECNSMHGYHFRVTLKDEKSIRDRKDYYIIDSKNSGVLFRNSVVENLNERYSLKRQKYEEEQKSIVKEVLEVAAGYSSNFEQLGNVISTLDVFTSFAVVAANSPTPYVRPILFPKGSGTLKFEGLRHPCVENQPGVDFIPNDIHFEKKERSFYIVTGPNMGGKSTFLRSVGVATLLAHVGCFVPAKNAEISIVDAILARVGACDFLSKGVSTFQAEMIETAFILKTATSDSLVLIDELGRGTSTCDGFGLCWAISQHLAKEIDCYCVLATHFHELAALAEEVKWVENVHVKAATDENGVTMLYKLGKGPCDRSFGIHVAEVNDFPEEVLEDARTMANILEDFSQEEYKDDSLDRVLMRREFRKKGKEFIKEFGIKANALEKKFDQTKEAEKAQFLIEMGKLNEEAKQTAQDNPYLRHILNTVDEELNSKGKNGYNRNRKRRHEDDESGAIPCDDNADINVNEEEMTEPVVMKLDGKSITVRTEISKVEEKSVEEIQEGLRSQKILSREEWEKEYKAISHKLYPFPE